MTLGNNVINGVGGRARACEVVRRGCSPSLGCADRDTNVHRPLPGPSDLPDGQAPFRGWHPRLGVAATLLTYTVAAPSSKTTNVTSTLPPPPNTPPPSNTVPPPALKDCAAAQLVVMPARARAGQLFLLGVPANALPGVERQITTDGPAGVS